MGKDPAVLWYFSDWKGGTSTLSRHLKGCYIDLLDSLFNNQSLTLDEIKTVLGSDFGQSWPALQKKFVKDENGNFYNERLRAEILKRKKFVAGRIENLKGNKESLHMDSHVESRNENELKNKVKVKKFTVPKIEDLIKEFSEKGLTAEKAKEQSDIFLNHYETVGWVVGKARSPMKNWKSAVSNWISRSTEFSTGNRFAPVKSRTESSMEVIRRRNQEIDNEIKNIANGSSTHIG